MTSAYPHLTYLLNSTRSRLRLSLIARTFSHALAGYIPLVCVAHVVVEALDLPALVWVWGIVLLTVCTISVSGTLVFFRWPSDRHSVIAADQALVSAELFASAWAARNEETVVARALRDNAEATASNAGNAFRLPLNISRPLAVLALSLFVSIACTQLALSLLPASSSQTTALTPDGLVQLRDTVSAIAEVLDQRAAAQDDAFTSALATALRDLAESAAIEDGDAGVFAERLADLSDYARSALQEWDAPASDPLLDIFDELSQTAHGAVKSSQSQASFPSIESANIGSSIDRLSEKLNVLNEEASTKPDAVQSAATADPDAAYDYAQPVSEALSAESDDPAPPSSTTGAPASPSDDATGGASAMAGDGTGELDSTTVETSVLTFEDMPEMALETEDMGEGMRMEEFFVPQTQEFVQLSDVAPHLGDHWRPQVEAEVTRRAIGAQDQHVASRYRLMLRDGVSP